jgi:ABC-2 type transport system permease protein
MAHYATLLLFEQERGPRARMEFAKGIESRYGDRRRVDDERPMYDIDGKRRSDNTVIYDRGGWVFWMLHDFLGRERALAGYRDFIRTWSQGPDHAGLQDFVAAMRPFAADGPAYDAFVRQWFEDKVMPEYRVSAAPATRNGEGWNVPVTIENIGTGRMPVEIAVTAGERWKNASGDSAVSTADAPATCKGRAQFGAFPSTIDPGYRESRATVLLDAGQKRTVTVRCDFRPSQVVVDPDVRVLQLNRKLAVARVTAPGGDTMAAR